MRSDYKHRLEVFIIFFVYLFAVIMLWFIYNEQTAIGFILTVLCVAMWTENIGKRIRDDIIEELKGKTQKESEPFDPLAMPEKRNYQEKKL